MQVFNSSYDYFFNELKIAAGKTHKLSPEEHIYLSQMLTRHMDPRSYFTIEDNGLAKPTLALLLKDALEGEEILRTPRFIHMGEVALHTIGVFPLSLERSLVGSDYFISMGTQAFESAYDRNQNPLFKAMALNFSNLVDLLNVSLALKMKTMTIEEMIRMWTITKTPGLKKALAEQGVFLS